VREAEFPIAFIARDLHRNPYSPRYYGHVESETPEPHMIEEGPLGALKVAEAVEALIRALASDDFETISAAAFALADNGDPRAVPPLVAVLDDAISTEERLLAGIAAAPALALFDDPVAHDACARWSARLG